MATSPKSARNNQFGLILTPKTFGAVGDGVADDTQAWTDFQAASGIKAVPPGRYKVNGEVLRFDKGCFGNGVFDDGTIAWTEMEGDRERDSVFVHGRDINANTTLLSPAVKIQTHVDFTRADPEPGEFKLISGGYFEQTLDGYWGSDEEGNQNFTVFGSKTLNRMAGLFGSLGGLFYCEDVNEEENPLIEVHGATKNGCVYLQPIRNSRYASGGYTFGLEVNFYNRSLDSDTPIPYTNSDFFDFTGWTANVKLTAVSNSAPISTMILMNGAQEAKHGAWNAITIGSSIWNINDNDQGPEGTVAVNMASWSLERGYPDIGLKFGQANWHSWFKSGQRVRANLSRYIHGEGPCGISVEAAGEGLGNSAYLLFRDSATDTPGPTPRTIARLDNFPSYSSLSSTLGEVRLEAENGTSIFSATAARFAPASAQDNTKALGGADRRWSVVFAGTGTINTSDARLKTQITDLSAAERRVAVACRGLLKKYKWSDAVASKGSAARWHFGIIAQDLMAAFAAEGLNAMDYGVLCYDTWGAQPEKVETVRVPVRAPIYEQVLSKPASSRRIEVSPGKFETVTDDAVYVDGKMLEPEVFEEVTRVTPAIPAGDRYGVRYDELAAFILCAILPDTP